ncbi:hypothetical protein [Saccharothrix coeruleofusca]|uniref:LigA protein n=1 Tax=Saccharothrix coeruleofusca TaxID=33919 RepID=A0A918EH79_9PSEU|nr:hypothetical protein [Saccharothrix coeruleofusca]MBP2334797.1 hypothetical protein [Saccharothrix coeruleofusca]GGP74089.1 hypothetical protein GCM10010185_54530 [Saccharothrix coeruleofusca]
MSELEKRYRWLLGFYPREHREQHGEEMLGVLIADAGERTTPGWRDTADLLWGAFRLHVRRLLAADVLAIVGLLGPIAVLAGATTSLHELAWWIRAGSVPPFQQLPDAPVWLVWLAVAILAVAGKRSAAAVGAWVATAGLIVVMQLPFAGWQWFTDKAGWVLLSAVTAFALSVSDGRGVRGRSAIVTMAVTVLVTVGLGVFGHREVIAEYAALVVLFAGAALAAGIRSAAGRRAALVLSAPVATALLARLVDAVHQGPINDTVSALIFFGAPLVFLVAVGGLVRLPRRTSAS